MGKSFTQQVVSGYILKTWRIEKDISITRVLAWWCKNNVIDELLELKDFDNIKKEYKKKFNYINYENPDSDLDDINISDTINNNDFSLSSSNLSSNYYSNSSDESSNDENNINDNGHDSGNNDKGDEDSENNNLEK